MNAFSLMRSKEAYARAQGSLVGGVSSGVRRTIKPHPIFFEEGNGSHLIDLDGNRYVDYVLGWGQNILGHAHPVLTAAVTDQLSRGTALGSGSVLEYQVAERVMATIPGVERVLWSNTGSEAAQIALRLARAATGRQRFVKFAGHYHGWSDAMLFGYRPDASGRLDGLGSRGQNPKLLSDVSLLPFGDLNAVKEVLSSPDSDIAAVFVDPFMCNSGLISPPPGFLNGLRDACNATGTLLIFDEVITGFRVDQGGAISLLGVVPDLVVLAKAISGGMPLSAVAGRAAIVDEMLNGVFYSGTYNGNLASMAAAAACLGVLSGDDVYSDFERRGRDLAKGFTQAFADFDVPATVNQVGPIVQCLVGPQGGDSLASYHAREVDFYERAIVHLLRNGVFAAPDGRWYISAVHSDEDIESTIGAFRASIGASLDEPRSVLS